jgi:cyanuric acid amidohydrolase
MKVTVHKIPQSAPDDISGLRELIESNAIHPPHVAAIMGKTEGNGCVNDFTRGFAVATLQSYLRSLIGAKVEGIVFVMSGGTEGVLSPHMTVFTCDPAPTTTNATTRATMALALGVHHTRDFLVREIGRIAMVEVVADGVKEAMVTARLTPKDVHLVQVKCPLITAAAARSTDFAVAKDSYKSMAYSRAASALGVAVALGEVTLEQVTDADICTNLSLYSSVASTSAGVELQNCEILGTYDPCRPTPCPASIFVSYPYWYPNLLNLLRSTGKLVGIRKRLYHWSQRHGTCPGCSSRGTSPCQPSGDGG